MTEDRRYMCIWCETEGTGSLPAECKTCTVWLSAQIVDLNTTYGMVIAQFEKLYGFHPGELFPRFKRINPTGYVRMGLLDIMARQVTADVYAQEDAFFIAHLEDSLKLALR